MSLIKSNGISSIEYKGYLPESLVGVSDTYGYLLKFNKIKIPDKSFYSVDCEVFFTVPRKKYSVPMITFRLKHAVKDVSFVEYVESIVNIVLDKVATLDFESYIKGYCNYSSIYMLDLTEVDGISKNSDNSDISTKNSKNVEEEKAKENKEDLGLFKIEDALNLLKDASDKQDTMSMFSENRKKKDEPTINLKNLYSEMLKNAYKTPSHNFDEEHLGKNDISDETQKEVVDKKENKANIESKKEGINQKETVNKSEDNSTKNDDKKVKVDVNGAFFDSIVDILNNLGLGFEIDKGPNRVTIERKNLNSKNIKSEDFIEGFKSLLNDIDIHSSISDINEFFSKYNIDKDKIKSSKKSRYYNPSDLDFVIFERIYGFKKSEKLLNELNRIGNIIIHILRESGYKIYDEESRKYCMYLMQNMRVRVIYQKYLLDYCRMNLNK